MKIQNLSHHYLVVALVFLILLCLPELAAADAIDDANDVPATAAEVAFINRIVDQVRLSMPPIDGWEQKVRVTVSGNTIRNGELPLIYERARDFPLKIAIRLDFKIITAADRQRVVAQKDVQQLQQELMAAAQSGDLQKMEQIQAQLVTSMQPQMAAAGLGQAIGTGPAMPAEKPKKFYAQIIVNGDGEHIGKDYDTEVTGVRKAFVFDDDDSDTLRYKYYLGAWDIGELDARNWKIVSPAAAQTPANHLRALVLVASIGGDRESVASYVADHLTLQALSDVLD